MAIWKGESRGDRKPRWNSGGAYNTMRLGINAGAVRGREKGVSCHKCVLRRECRGPDEQLDLGNKKREKLEYLNFQL